MSAKLNTSFHDQAKIKIMMIENCPAQSVRFRPEESNYILCRYKNDTDEYQILKISNIPNWYFERVIAPSAFMLFQAPPEAQLEIHTGMMVTAILSDTIPCTALTYHS